jgi:menaquinone-specific isochorismate synthase
MVKSVDESVSVEDEFIRTKIYYENRLPVTLTPISRAPVDKFRDIPDQKTYAKTIFSVLGRIKPGQLEKVVISRSHHVKVGKNFSGISAMQILRNAYPKCVSFFFSFPDKGIFFGSTPERLIRLKNRYIQTEALAGTIARGNNMEEDRILAKKLMGSHKEREEHSLVMEQIVRKLEPIIPHIQYPSSPQILKLKNVQHLQTPITGELNQVAHILNLVKRLHPTSAVAGTPTDKSMEVISEMELHDRGWYSGPIGWVDKKGDGEFYVALRSALVKDEEAHVFSGGGIVSESHPDTEWEETELKLQPIISALSGGQI